ncbi:MAG: glycosyltransferase family 4 protein, partial [Propionibacteriaceae bacterium]|nr:glycosyltransferase family 4 protein [Propionibacteriaceae bacterium]
TAAIVGDGPLRDRIEPEAAAADVELLGRRSDVPDLLRESTVMAMTSAADTEGMPGVLIEAALSGIPAVSTLAAGVADVVIDGRTGRTVTDTAEAVADGVAEFLTSTSHGESVGAHARERALKLFTIRANAEAWRALVAKVGAPRGPRSRS